MQSLEAWAGTLLPLAASWAFLLVFLAFLGSWCAISMARRKLAFQTAFLVAVLCPAALLTLVWITSLPRFGDLRMAVEGFRFNIEAMDGEIVSIGGSRDDHLVVRGLPEAMVQFEIQQGQVQVKWTPRNEDGAAVGALRLDRSKELFGAHELEAGATLADSAGAMASFDPQEGRLTVDGGPTVQIPRRVSTILRVIKLPIGRQLPPQSQIYPLRYFAREAGSDQPRLDGQGRPLAGFLYRESGSGGAIGSFLREDFFYTLLDPDVTLSVGGSAKAFSSEVVTLGDGDSHHFALFRVDFREPDSEGRSGSRVQELRSFRARVRSGHLEVLLDTPGVMDLRRSLLDDMRQLRRNENLSEDVLLSLSSRDRAMLMPSTQMALVFGFIGEPLIPELFTRIEAPATGPYFKVTSHRGTQRFSYGDGFQVGDDSAVIARLHRQDMPWGVPIFVWILALCTWITAQPLCRGSLLRLVVLTGTEMLLVVRVLIAYEAVSLDYLRADATWRSLGALAAVPLVLQGALYLYRGFKNRALLVPLFTVRLAALAWALLESGTSAGRLVVVLVGGGCRAFWPVGGIPNPRRHDFSFERATQPRHGRPLVATVAR